MTPRVYWSATISLVIFWAFSTSTLQAATGGIPALSTPLQSIVQTIGGPVLAALGTLSLVVCGLSIAYSQGHGYDRLGNLIIGLSIAFGATAIIGALWSAFGLGATVTVDHASTLSLVVEDMTSLSVHGWLSYLGWKGIRYAQRLTRRV